MERYIFHLHEEHTTTNYIATIDKLGSFIVRHPNLVKIKIIEHSTGKEFKTLILK